MSDSMKLQGEVSLSVEPAVAALGKVGAASDKMAIDMQKAGERAGAAIGQIGDIAKSSGEKMNRAESVMVSSVKRLATDAAQAKSIVEGLGNIEFNIAAKGLDPAKFRPMIDIIKSLSAESIAASAQMAAASSSAGVVAGSALNSMGMSAKATAASLRGVPAQFQDIIVSLQGGQAPLTVFLQQGSQLSGMFGGAGNAAKALGGYVVGLVNPLTLAAGAAAALGMAYYQGSGEAQAFATSLIMSGNAAGTTAGQLMDMAKSVSSATGATRGAVAETLNEIAASGKVSADVLAQVGKAAIDMERAGGQAASATVKEFVALGEAPVDAILKLDSKYHFLTASVYEQIKALKDQGRETEAAKLAQTTYADALEGRIPSLVANIGTLEGAWKGVGNVAKLAWDSMLNVGRPDSLEEKLAEAKRKLAGFASERGNGNFGEKFTHGNSEDQARVNALSNEIEARDQLLLIQKATNEANAAGIKTVTETAKLREKYLTNTAKLEKELAEIAKSSLSTKEKENAVIMARKQYADKPKEGTKNDATQQYAASLAAEKDFAAAHVKLIKARVTEGVESEEDGLKEVLASQISTYAKEREILKAQLAETKDIGKKAEIEKGISGIGLGMQVAAAEYVSALAKIEQADAKYKLSQVDKANDSTRKIDDENEKLREQIDILGLTDIQIGEYEAAKVRAAAASEYLAASTLREVAATMEAAGSTNSVIPYYRQLAEAREAAGKALDKQGLLESEKGMKKAAVEADKEWKKTADKIGDNITDALMRGFESGKGFAETMRDTIVNMFKTMVLKPIIQATVMGGMSALGMGSATAADGGGMSLGGLANMASTAKSVWGIGSTISNGAGALPFTTSLADGSGMLGGDSIGTLMQLNPQWGVSTNLVGAGLDAGVSAGVNGTQYVSMIEAGSTAEEALLASTVAVDAATVAAASYAAAAGTIGGTASIASVYSVGATGAGAAGAAPGLAAMGPVGIVLAAAVLAYMAFSKEGGGPQPSGDYFGKINANGGINQQAESTIAGDSTDNWYTGTESNGNMSTMGVALGRSVANTLKSLGGSAAGVGLNFGMSTDPQGTSDDTVKASVTNAAGEYIYTNNHSVDKGKGGEALLLEFQRMGIAAIKAADDIKPVFKEVVSGIDLMTADAATLTQVLADVQAVVGLRDAFKNLNLNADNLSMSIINASGGISTLSTELGNYYAAYFTEAERTAKTSDAVTKAFKDMGVALPDSKEAFRKVVEGLDLTTASGSATFTAMMDLAPAFATVADAAAAAAKVVSDAAKAAAEAAAKAASEYAAAQRAEKKARADGAQSVLDTLKSSYADIQSSLAEAAKAASGGSVGGLSYSGSEYESVTQFSAYLDEANVQLKAIASSGYATELTEYTAQIKALAKSVSDQAADTLYASRLKSGDVAGAIDAALSKHPLKYTDYMDTRQGAKPDRSAFATRDDFDHAFAKWDSNQFNSGAFNRALEKARMEESVKVGNYQSANALSLQNVTGGYSAQNASAEFKYSIFSDISKQYGIGTQTALQNVLSKALDAAVSQNIRANYTSTGPGVASVQAAQYDYAASAKSAYVGDKIYVGAGAIAYAEGVKAVTAALSHGAITIADYRKGVAMLTGQFGSEYDVNTARLASGAAAQNLANAGLTSTSYYFGKLAEGVKALSDAASKASEPVSLAAESIGRMNSASSVFAQSADAIMQGYMGMVGAGQSVIGDSTSTSEQYGAALSMIADGLSGQKAALTEGSLYRKGELVSMAAGLASGIMTTQSAAAAAAAIAKAPSFAGYTDTQIRDVSMMMDGLAQYDSGAMEKTFNRLSNALATGVLTEAQYIDLFGKSVETFKGVDTAVEATKTAMQSLADAMKSFADEILIDAGKTTLTTDQTMAETMRQYGVAMSSAMTGDSTAVSTYKTLAESLLDKSKYATQSDYNDAFGKVYGDAKNIEAVGVASVARANGESKVVTELKSLNTNLTNRVDTLEKNLTAALAQIARNTAKTSAGIDQINVNGIAA